MEKNIIFYGSAKQLTTKHILRAGVLDVIYENGCLRYISANKVELIRNIYSAVRDKNWGTILPEIVEEDIDIQQDSFKIAYTALYKNEEINFIAHYQIFGKADSSISLIMKGKALNTFQKNRIGFCILHPLQGVKGLECTVNTPTGEVVKAHFPVDVSAFSPMKNIKQMAWENEIAACKLSFEGDIWEMEDHRNWTDSSFKTFCTPLAIPYPVEIKEDTEINQNVSFSISLKQPASDSQIITKESKFYTFKIEEEHQLTLPKIGLGESSLGRKLTDNEANILKQAKFYHLRFDLKISNADWKEQLEIAHYNAQAMGAKLELVIHFSKDIQNDLVTLSNYFKNNKLPLAMLWVIDKKTRLTHTDLIAQTSTALRELFPQVVLGGGADAYFAEFNRNIFDAKLFDFVTFAVSPQVHAFDNDTLVENIESQFDVLESSAKLYPNKKLMVSPVTLRQRFNVVATSEDSETPENQLPYPVDERQMSLFAAGWTLGSIGAIAKGKCDAVTYYETIGWQGVIQGEDAPAKPTLFAGKKGDIFPVYHLFAFLNQLQSTHIQLVKSSNPLKFSALKLTNTNTSFLVLANHLNENLVIKIEKNNFTHYKTIDEDNVMFAFQDFSFLEKMEWQEIDTQEISLKPYSLTFIQSNVTPTQKY